MAVVAVVAKRTSPHGPTGARGAVQKEVSPAPRPPTWPARTGRAVVVVGLATTAAGSAETES